MNRVKINSETSKRKPPKPLKNILAHARSYNGLTMQDVAIRMGVTQPAVSKIENNARSASIKTLERYAAACNHKLIVRLEPLDDQLE